MPLSSSTRAAPTPPPRHTSFSSLALAVLSLRGSRDRRWLSRRLAGGDHRTHFLLHLISFIKVVSESFVTLRNISKFYRVQNGRVIRCVR